VKYGRRRADGEYRWVMESGHPAEYAGLAGEFGGLAGVLSRLLA